MLQHMWRGKQSCKLPSYPSFRSARKLLDLVQQDLAALVPDCEPFAALRKVDTGDVVQRSLLSRPVLVDRACRKMDLRVGERRSQRFVHARPRRAQNTHELELILARLARECDELRVVVESHRRHGRDEVLDRLPSLALATLGVRAARRCVVHVYDTRRRPVSISESVSRCRQV